ncbi:hypothetical protein CAPN010_16820 [Capnocytophaga cynodegmi]|uniref:hypothetical protein n=1 Tax=Capnocytophaga cynodegmi TaxID=28189 RepID=UPI001EE2AAAD|nr:hypothetical protein [Capnocytophaga cynodegmi]GJQ07524.1 hypothetical protein CAPN010_16820 [Capnocytophaga cynodegmi]
MFKEKIFEMLKTKYANIGFSKEVLEGVATNLSAFVKEETQIEPAVNGAELMLKSFQSYADNRVNAFKNESEKYKKEAEELKVKLAGGNPNPPKKEEGEGSSEMAKIVEMFNSLQKTVSGLQAEKTSQTLKETFVQKMKDKQIPESFYESSLFGREFTESGQVEDLANQISAGYEKFKQDAVNTGFTYTQPPEKGAGEKVEVSDEEASNIINQM